MRCRHHGFCGCVFDVATAREYLHRYGSFEPERAADVLAELLRHDRSGRHITVYLQAIREALR